MARITNNLDLNVWNLLSDSFNHVQLADNWDKIDAFAAHTHDGTDSVALAANSVGTTQITNNAVTTAKIADNNVTTAKIADANVTTAKIADANVTAAKLAADTVGVTALSAVQVREVGAANQVRAGRVLAPTDFTNMGLSAPLGLWSLGNLSDTSGNGRTLVQKGSPNANFVSGITGATTEAAEFIGNSGQALYISTVSDAAAELALRIRTGSWGFWFRTAKRGTVQNLMTKWGPGAAGTQGVFSTQINSSNNFVGFISSTGGDNFAATGSVDVADDRWHFAIVTHDGTKLRTYIDGALDGQTNVNALMFAGSAPLNIGGYGADATNVASNPFFGRVDEAFITSDVLSDDQVRNLYCARIPHTLNATPVSARIRVTRRRRGGPYVTTDFPATPARLYNFTAGALTDDGSNATTVGNAGTAPISVAGPDGVKDSGYSLAGGTSHFSSTDAGLPSGTTARTYGCWFKTTVGNTLMHLLAWGTAGTADARIQISASGMITTFNGADFAGTSTYVADGLWHYVVGVEDNAATDVKRKVYCDGRVVAGSTVLNSITLAGAGRFRIGAAADGTTPFTGQISRAFVYAGAMTDVQVRALYNKGSQALAPSPKSEGDHIEAIEATSVLATFDTLEASDQVDLRVIR